MSRKGAISMRKLLVVAFVLSSTWVFSTATGDNAEKRVLILSGPRIDAELMGSSLRFLKSNIRGSIRSEATLFRVDAFSVKEQLRVFNAMRSDGDCMVVVLVNAPPSGDDPIVAFSEELHVAVVNVYVIINAKELSQDGKRARVERALMYAIGRSAKIAPCLNPLCAMSEYEYGMDATPGRNYCPSCCDIVAEEMMALGVNEPEGNRNKVSE